MNVAQFIETDILYRLVWGIEAARVYEVAQGNFVADLIDGSATAALEAGTLSRSAAVLLRSGFDHRSAAIRAVGDTMADFIDTAGMRDWVSGLDSSFANDPAWPTVASRSAWEEFAARLRSNLQRRWGRHEIAVEQVLWTGQAPSEGQWLRVTEDGPGRATVWSPGFDRLGSIAVDLNPNRVGVLHAVCGPGGSIYLRYRGPDDVFVDDAGPT